MKPLSVLVTAIALSVASQAQTLPAQRTVNGSSVLSAQDPAVRVTLKRPGEYIGAVRFVLFGSADCEIHLFVEADAARQVRRLYWVHFEAYLPEHPALVYVPGPSYAPVQLAGKPFYQRARFGRSDEVPRPGSDTEAVYALLKAKGYTLPPETVNVTYKHFFGDGPRKELLLIVMQDMALMGTSFAELVQNGKLQPGWAPIAERLLQDASGVFDLDFDR